MTKYMCAPISNLNNKPYFPPVPAAGFGYTEAEVEIMKKNRQAKINAYNEKVIAQGMPWKVYKD